MDSYKMRVTYSLRSKPNQGGVVIEVPKGEESWSYAYDHVREHVEVPEDMVLVVGDVVAVEGPLVRSIRWYDLHGPGNVIYAEAAHGHVLEEEVCDRIAASLADLGLTVVARWNVGSCGVSFRAKGRKDAARFTARERRALRGPERVSEETTRRAADARRS